MVMLNNIDISKLALLNLTYHLVKTKSKKIIYGFYPMGRGASNAPQMRLKCASNAP